MALITNTEVFDFVGAPADVVTSQGTVITTLIVRIQKEIEQIIGRKTESTTITNVLFQDGLNCAIHENKLFLKGIYRDLYTISAITEAGTSLTVVSDYNDGNDYFLDTVKGVILRKDRFWNTESYAIKISGSVGIGGASSSADIKQAAIEMTAARSGLWKINTTTEGGDITTIRTTPTQKTLEIIKKYKLRDF